MSSTLVVPFDFNPLTTTIKSSLYTVPVGRRVRARPFFISPGAVSGTAPTYTIGAATVNGVAIFHEGGFKVTQTLVASSSIFTTPSNFSGRIYGSINNGAGVSADLTVGGEIIATVPAVSTKFFDLPIVNGSVAIAWPSGGAHSANLYLLNEVNSVNSEYTWFPEGTQLSGSGSNWRWIVEEYNNII